MSMWSLMAAPLLFSGDMSKLDSFTLNVLCNSEVIDIDQDRWKQGVTVRKTDDEFILEKPLDDGSLAVGFFNLTSMPRDISANWEELKLSGAQTVRDVGARLISAHLPGSLSSQVPSHGVILVKLSPADGQHTKRGGL